MSDPDDHWDEAMANDGDRFDDEEEFDEEGKVGLLLRLLFGVLAVILKVTGFVRVSF